MFLISIDHDLARLIGLDVPDPLSGLTDDDGPDEGFVGPTEGCTAQSTEPEKGIRVIFHGEDVFVKDGDSFGVSDGILTVNADKASGYKTLAVFLHWSYAIKVG